MLCLPEEMLDSSKTMKLEDCNFSFVKIQIAVLRFWKEKFSISFLIFLKCPNFTFGHRLETAAQALFSHNCNFLNDNWHFGVKRFTQFRHTTNAFNGSYTVPLNCLWNTLTVFENHQKYRIWIFQFWHFPSIFVPFKLTCLVTL